jgi:hypothetical protein
MLLVSSLQKQSQDVVLFAFLNLIEGDFDVLSYFLAFQLAGLFLQVMCLITIGVLRFEKV